MQIASGDPTVPRANTAERGGEAARGDVVRHRAGRDVEHIRGRTADGLQEQRRGRDASALGEQSDAGICRWADQSNVELVPRLVDIEERNVTTYHQFSDEQIAPPE